MDAMDKRRRVEELLKPEGKPLGEKPRQRGQVRRVPADVERARALFEELRQLG